MPATLTFSEEFDTLHFWDGTSGLDARPAWGLQPWGDQGFSYGTDTWYVQPGTAASAAAGAFSVGGGVLTLSARSAATPYYYADGNGGAHHYTSGMVTTAHEFSQTYGYFEIRAEISHTAGTLPAFWLMPVNQPTDGSFASELDVMEILGSDPTTLYTTAHSAVSGADQRGAQHFHTSAATTIADASAGFHTYGVDWQADKITWYFDGQAVFQTDTPSDMHGAHYLIANLDGPAGWQGQPDSSQPYEPDFRIDYIRAYSSVPVGPAPTPAGSAPSNGGAPAAAPDPAPQAVAPTTNDVPAQPAPTPPSAPTLPASPGASETPSEGEAVPTHADPVAPALPPLAQVVAAPPSPEPGTPPSSVASAVVAASAPPTDSHPAADAVPHPVPDLPPASSAAPVASDPTTPVDASPAVEAFVPHPVLPSAPTTLPSGSSLPLPESAGSFGTVARDASSAGGAVYALYDALFDRVPDTFGFETQTKLVEDGLSVQDLAARFLTSAEGSGRYGGLGDADFLETLYRVALDRSGDTAGLAHWQDALAHGRSRADVAASFAQSDEHLGRLQGAYDAGIFVPDQDAADVARLYHAVLGRAPDADGLRNWTNDQPLAAVAAGFVNSDEGQAKLGRLSDTAFVDSLYQGALGRAAEADGLHHYTDALAHGTARAAVALEIAQSLEALHHLEPAIETGWVLA